MKMPRPMASPVEASLAATGVPDGLKSALIDAR
jgi:hypothetical protein